MSLLLAPAPADGFFDVGAAQLLALLLAGGALACLVLVLGRLRALERRLDRFDALDDLPAALHALRDSAGELDLRRIEHLLLDLREDQRKLHGRLMQIAENATAVPEVVVADGADRPAPVRAPLVERVTNRLLALGYERIQLLGDTDRFAAVDAAGEGEVLVEARRGGAVCKGRITIHEGAISDVEVRSSHEMFP